MPTWFLASIAGLKGTVSRDFLLLVLFITGGKFAASIVVDTGGKFATGVNNTRGTGGKICRRCRWHRWCTLTCEYLCKFSKKFEMILILLSGAWGKVIHEKNLKQKISWHCPFKLPTLVYKYKMYILNSVHHCTVCIRGGGGGWGWGYVESIYRAGIFRQSMGLKEPKNRVGIGLSYRLMESINLFSGIDSWAP